MQVRRRILIIALVVGAAVLLGIGGAAQNYIRARTFNMPWDWATGLSDNISEWLVIAALTPLPLFMTRRYRLTRSDLRRRILLHLLAGIVFAIAAVSLIALLVVLRRPDLRYFFTMGKVGTFYVIYYFALYWAVAGIAHAAHYVVLEEQLTRERLELLRSKLNPHFLFNTLNAISTMALQRDHEGVTHSIALVGDLLRAGLDESMPMEIPLSRELDLAEKYLAIQKIRFGDRLGVEKSIHPQTLDAVVPGMLLQPLLENAVVHGVTSTTGQGWVRIETKIDNGALHIVVSDSGRGFSDSRRTGIGLGNTRARLETMYGSKQRLDIGAEANGGARVEITIPHRRSGS